MLLAGKNQVWVMCHSSNVFALVDLKLGKVTSSVHCQKPPLAFAITNGRIWYVDQMGSLNSLPLSGGPETRIDVNGVASIAFLPGARTGDLLCGSARNWLVVVKTESLLSIQSRITRLERDMESLQKAMNNGDREAFKQSQLDNNLDRELHDQLLACVKPLTRPSSGQENRYYGNTYYLQSLFLDPPHHRLYFNRMALELEQPENMLGQFADVEHSMRSNGEVNRFFNDFPYYQQILALSPDGKISPAQARTSSTPATSPPSASRPRLPPRWCSAPDLAQHLPGGSLQ